MYNNIIVVIFVHFGLEGFLVMAESLIRYLKFGFIPFGVFSLQNK